MKPKGYRGRHAAAPRLLVGLVQLVALVAVAGAVAFALVG